MNTNPTWTTDLPQRDGFYWVQKAPADPPGMVEVMDGSVYSCGVDEGCPLRDCIVGTLWYGPIPAPPALGARIFEVLSRGEGCY